MTYIKKVPRKDLLVFGGIGCAVCLHFISYFTYRENAIGNISFQLLYRIIYGLSVSAGTWPYCNEIVPTDKIYIPFMSHWIMITIVVFMFPIVSQMISTQAVFLGFS